MTIVRSERWVQKNYGPRKLGSQRWAAHKDRSRKMGEGRKVRLVKLFVPRKLEVPESALSGPVKITLTIYAGFAIGILTQQGINTSL